MIKSIFNWSGGKDSALALYKVLNEGQFEIHTLMTTVNSHFNRISMHGVRKELLQAQGKSIGLPIKEILLPEMPSMSEYDQTMKNTLSGLKKEGITHSIFGDIFLEDLKQYREDRLAEVGIKGHFPLWKKDTKELIHEFIDLGFKTIVICTKAELLPSEFAGRIIDKEFLKDLPKDVDPCGENGEFHTFVYDGPIFKEPVSFSLGEKVFKSYNAPKDKNDSCLPADEKPKPQAGFHYCDLIPD
ncbi:diphthine--ammonia ligase [Echinicola jeungdonensis]|uniref:Diphthine--ammonia ligase n=1 Tax=Echinicola jeungdonensis TaxID=709343 RepID=A0ABV5J630_9BACT|nr:diphthine--ammonia ligase [Echinicola jeungdonensis]MDN3671030.1 diphthine--ammonia ligase [Echinicola jeungdonensis]